MALAYHFHCAMCCLNLSASAAVKVSAIQNAENAARKVVKMFKTSAKKTALSKSCVKEDVSSQGETKRYLSAYVKSGLQNAMHLSIPVKHSKLGAKTFNKACPTTVQNAQKWPLQLMNFQKFSVGACPRPSGAFFCSSILPKKTRFEKC